MKHSELIKKVEEVLSSDNTTPNEMSILSASMNVLDDLLDKKININDAASSESVIHLQKRRQEEEECQKQNRTGKLWLQYSEMIEILRRFVRAERTGNWLLHLQAVRGMMPFMAVSGINAYTKST